MAFLVLPSGFSASGSFENLSGSEPHWERMDFQRTRNHGILWSCCCIPDDFRLPSLLARRSGDLAPGDPQKKLFLWIGEYSMGIFLTHWLVIASFSCWFYSIYSEAGEKLAIGVNLVLSCILIGICSKVYVWLVDGKIFPCVWKCAKNILKRKSVTAQ